MPTMSVVEQAFCRSAPWRRFAGSTVLPWALQDVQLAGDVLEIGGGSGVMAEHTMRRFPELRMTVTDFDPKMVAMATRRLASWPNAVAAPADVTALPFAEHSFDAVVSYLMLHHVIEWEAAIREVARVLRPGGTFVGYDLDDTRLADWTHRLDGSPYRLIAAEDLTAALVGEGLEVAELRRGLGHHVVRFVARRPALD